LIRRFRTGFLRLRAAQRSSSPGREPAMSAAGNRRDYTERRQLRISTDVLNRLDSVVEIVEEKRETDASGGAQQQTDEDGKHPPRSDGKLGNLRSFDHSQIVLLFNHLRLSLIALVQKILVESFCGIAVPF